MLVHGAFADGSSWNGVSSRLQRAGYPVLVPALPMRGLASDTNYLASVLRTIKGPVVLAGHSYAGIVIGQAAAEVRHVEALVFVDGFALDVGESAMDIGARFPMNLLGPALISRPYPLAGGGEGNDLYVDRAKFPRIFGADLPRTQQAVLAASQRPIEATAFSEKVTAAAWKTIPSSFVFGERDRAIDPAALMSLAKRAGGPVRVVRGGSHLTLIRPRLDRGEVDHPFSEVVGNALAVQPRVLIHLDGDLSPPRLDQRSERLTRAEDATHSPPTRAGSPPTRRSGGGRSGLVPLLAMVLAVSTVSSLGA